MECWKIRLSGHNHGPHHLPEDFEALYASGIQWSGNPNDALVREVSGVTPGSALDVGCGEGADAVWLAGQGWDVVAVDPSPTAIDRSRALAGEKGLSGQIEFLIGSASAAGGRTYDLVTCAYVPFHRGQIEEVHAVEQLVSPGGMLLWVHHDVEFSDILSPRDVAKLLQELEVIDLKTSKRHVTSGAGAHHSDDVVLICRRPQGK